jgi:hypothetical protein
MRLTSLEKTEESHRPPELRPDGAQSLYGPEGRCTQSHEPTTPEEPSVAFLRSESDLAKATDLTLKRLLVRTIWVRFTGLGLPAGTPQINGYDERQKNGDVDDQHVSTPPFVLLTLSLRLTGLETGQWKEPTSLRPGTIAFRMPENAPRDDNHITYAPTKG